MREDVRMVKAAQKKANRHTAQKNEFSLCLADASNQYEDNGFLVVLGDGQDTLTADNYSGAQRVPLKSHQLIETVPITEDCRVAGHALAEGCNENDSRPSPVLLEGKEVDVLQLCTEVMARGGYERVTDASMWSLISESIGLGQNCGAAVKRAYAKYLESLAGKQFLKNVENVDRWFRKSVEESSTGVPECDAIGNGSSISPDSSACYQESNGESKRRKLSCLMEDHAVGNSFPEYSVPTSKGTESLVGMVEWLRRLALNPGDSKKGQGPRGSKENEAWVEDCWSMAIKARAVLWGRKELIYYGGLSGSMAKHRIPPALYYKEFSKPNTRTLEKLRANQTRAMKCGLHLPGDSMDLQAVRPLWLYQTPSQMLGGQHVEQGVYLSSDYVKSMSEALSIGYLLNNKNSRKRIPIGTPFQAQVPSGTGELLKESEGFCGESVWPLPDTSCTSSDVSRVGRGRPLRCACTYPMSLECVRLHVAEEREKLHKEISDAFNSWGFNDMGESVSTRWTRQEEHAFELTVKLNPLSMGKNFWDELPAALPLKTMKELVSYYFNVFVVRRRAVENRTTPNCIDSDDDERELSSSGTYSAFARNMRVQCENLSVVIPNFLALHRETTASVPNTATSCCPLEKI